MRHLENFRTKFSEWRSTLRNTLPGSFRNLENADSVSTQSLAESSSHRNASTASDYTELHRGSVPCPSCKGSGLIPKELESTLVALIPVNDERLKPKRTWLIVTFWVLICFIIGGIILYLLMPRTVTLSSDEMPIEIVHVTDRRDVNTSSFIDFTFFNKINVTSGNYLPVDLDNITATITSKFQPWSSDLVGSGKNSTITGMSPFVLYRNTRELMFNNSVHLTGYVSNYCQAPFSRLTSLYVTLQFDVTATLTYYYGHSEQVSLSTQQQVCCIPSGNCTTNWWMPNECLTISIFFHCFLVI